jgi:hypothetical protein
MSTRFYTLIATIVIVIFSSNTYSLCSDQGGFGLKFGETFSAKNANKEEVSLLGTVYSLPPSTQGHKSTEFDTVYVNIYNKNKKIFSMSGLKVGEYDELSITRSKLLDEYKKSGFEFEYIQPWYYGHKGKSKVTIMLMEYHPYEAQRVSSLEVSCDLVYQP